VGVGVVFNEMGTTELGGGGFSQAIA